MQLAVNQFYKYQPASKWAFEVQFSNPMLVNKTKTASGALYSLKSSGNNWFSKTPGSNWVMIPLYREDAGREVRVEITPVYENFRDRQVDFLIGSELAIYKDRLFKDLPQLVLGIMAVFIGVVFACVSCYTVHKKKRGKNLLALGIFSTMMGFWRLTDTRFTPFLLKDKPLLLFYISITMLMLGMIGEYIGRIYISLNNSPQYVIRDEVNFQYQTGEELVQ